MKKLLLASTALVLSAGVASAQGVTLSGDARMGIGYNSAPIGTNQSKMFITSRARVTFTLSGETDTGLAFGASFRADNAGPAASGTGGAVFMSGEFGRLTMGDTAGAAQFVIGHVPGVGLTGLGDHNESTYLGNQGDIGSGTGSAVHQRPTARYQYELDGFTFAFSISNPGRNSIPVTGAANGFGTNGQIASIAAGYEMSGFSVGLGYEAVRRVAGTNTSLNHIILGVGYELDGLTLAANVGRVGGSAVTPTTPATRTQYQVGASYVIDATTVSAFYARNFNRDASYGIGASYDLGGGASLTGGIVSTNVDTLSTAGASRPNSFNGFGSTATTNQRRTIADFGIAFTF